MAGEGDTSVNITGKLGSSVLCVYFRNGSSGKCRVPKIGIANWLKYLEKRKKTHTHTVYNTCFKKDPGEH